MKNKFKEFWIYNQYVFDSFDDADGWNRDDEQKKIIHVIEYAALQACEARLESANAEFERYKVDMATLYRDETGKCYNTISDLKSENAKLAEQVTQLSEANTNLRTALEEINKEELNNQRPGGGYSRSAKISFEALKSIKE